MNAGIGHNRPRASLEQLAEDAAAEVANLDREIEAAVDSTRGRQLKALAAIYQLHLSLEKAPRRKARFFEERGIMADARVKYPAQPLIRHLMVGVGRHLRVKASLWAGAIAWAERHKVKPGEFIEFIRSCENGIDGAYRSEAEAQQSKADRENRALALRAATRAYQSSIQPEPVSANGFLKGTQPGKHLLIVETDDDGEAQVVARLERKPEQVEAIYDGHVLDWHGRNGGK